MGLIDWIRKLFGNGKKNPLFISKKLTKTQGTSDPLEVGLYDGKTPLTGKTVYITINDVIYQRTTDDNGICKLNINLGVGKLPAYFDFNGDEQYNPASGYATVEVLPNKKDTRMEGTDLNMTYKDGTQYQCAVYGPNNERVFDKVDLTVNGVTYNKTPDTNGLYKLNINLDAGNYTINAEFKGNNEYASSSVINSINISKAPEPTPTECPKPYTSSPHPTADGCNAKGQNNSYCCACSSVHKCLYKFGIRDITQGTLASWMGTTSSGTSHAGIESGIAMVNKTKGTNITIKWYNFSDLGWDEIGKILCQPNKAIFCHILYKNGGTCSGSGNYGHYELLTKVNTDTGYVKVLNSLGNKCSQGCYCGFYQDRTMACQEQFMRGISQKSIAVLTKN